MKKSGWIAIAAVVLIAVSFNEIRSFASTRFGYGGKAAMRVKSMLGGWAVGEADGAYGEQTACSQWALGVMIMPSAQELDWASNHFDQWRREKDLMKTISSWELLELEVRSNVSPRTAVAKVLIEGRPYTLVVPERLPIRWDR